MSTPDKFRNLVAVSCSNKKEEPKEFKPDPMNRLNKICSQFFAKIDKPISVPVSCSNVYAGTPNEFNKAEDQKVSVQVSC